MTRNRTRTRIATAALAALALTVLAAAPADAAMRSDKISKGLCETTGGGRFVNIPGFPGEKIDRRLLRDIRWMKRKFDIFVTDGYSTASYHSRNGEHPIGLALDIVPDGHGWRKISRLAKKAEPRQNQPKLPWRWVGYNGDANHGRGDHLHLSYAHSDTGFNEPAKTIYTRLCPDGAKRVKTAPKLSASSPFDLLAPAVPDQFGVTEANWRDAAKKVPEFIASETPLFVGRGVAAMVADPNVAAKNGRVIASWDLGDEYQVDDADGARPHFYRWIQANMPAVAAGWKKLDDTFYSYWGPMPYGMPGGGE